MLSFVGIPEQLHSTRLSAIILIIYALSSYNTISSKNIYKGTIAYNQFRKYILICSLLTFISILLYILIGKREGSHAMESMLNIMIFGLPVIWAISVIFNDVDEIMCILLYVGILQSIAIIICLADPNIATIIDITLNSSDTDAWYSSHRNGYAGGIGCITSSGVVKFSVSMLACIYLYLKSSKKIYIILYLFFSVIASLIARTGLLYALIGLFFIIYVSPKKTVFLKFIFTMLFIGLCVFLFVPEKELMGFIDERFGRYEYLQDESVDNGFFYNYFVSEDVHIPPLSIDTFFGVGMLSGTSGNGYIVNIDGGFLRFYSAFGLPITIMYYFFLMNTFWKLARNQKNNICKFIMYLFYIFIIIAEFKEPSFLSIWSLTLYFSLALILDNKVYNLYSSVRTE